MVFESDDNELSGALSNQVMTEPVFSYLNITNSTDTTHGMWGLTAASCEVLEPTDEDYKTYGLDDPYCEVMLKGEEYDYDLKKLGRQVSFETMPFIAPVRVGDKVQPAAGVTFAMQF